MGKVICGGFKRVFGNSVRLQEHLDSARNVRCWQHYNGGPAKAPSARSLIASGDSNQKKRTIEELEAVLHSALRYCNTMTNNKEKIH